MDDLRTRAKYPKTAQTAATKLPSLSKILRTKPTISAVIFLPSTTKSLRGFPKKAKSTTMEIHVTIVAGTTTAIDTTPNTAPSSTDAYTAGQKHDAVDWLCA